MDNITHTLTGLMLSRAGLNRMSPRATAVVLLAANAPDVDVVSALGGAASYLHYHRALTHSLAAIPLVALLPLLAVRLPARRPIAWKGAYIASLIGVASHVLMDWTNGYGVRLLLPFSGKWFNADVIAVVDIWLWAALLLGGAAPLLSRLVSAEIGARPTRGFGMAVFVLSFYLCYGFGRYLLHERAVDVLNARLYRNEEPRRVAAIPSPVNPFRWTGLVGATGFYGVYPDLDLLREFDPAAGRIFYKPEFGPAIEEARRTQPVRDFLEFSQWPLWQVTPLADPENGTLVEAMDLRFGAPPQPRFVASTILDERLRVIRTGFRFGSPGEYAAKTP